MPVRSSPKANLEADKVGLLPPEKGKSFVQVPYLLSDGEVADDWEELVWRDSRIFRSVQPSRLSIDPSVALDREIYAVEQR